MLLSSIAFAEDVNLDTYQPLVSDVKSYVVGEPVVVIVVEATLAEASAGTGVETNRGISATVGGNDGSKFQSAGMDIDSNSEGAGKTSRKGRVTTQISVTIDEVLENGMLKIKGKQDITINGEIQRITLSGLVRASDISKNNSIYSSQIANVKLEIDGDGKISNAQKQNIIYRLMNWLGLL